MEIVIFSKIQIYLKGCEVMKKLICATDMEKFLKDGNKKFYIDKDTILTPSARDIAKNSNIEIIIGEGDNCICNDKKSSIENLEVEKMMDMLKVFMNEGLIQEIIKKLSQTKNSKFDVEGDITGFSIVKGNSIKMELFDPEGDPNAFYQELFSDEKSGSSMGIFSLEDTTFPYEVLNPEILYLVSGKMSLNLNNSNYNCEKGDIIFIPPNSKIVFKTKEKTEMLYITNVSLAPSWKKL